MKHKVLNLDPYFNPFGTGIKYEYVSFPSGCEEHIRLKDTDLYSVTITTRIRSSKDVMRLLLATDAIRRTGTKSISLFLPYLPYARQDREMVPGEPLSLKVFADLLNAQNYDRVSVFDVHSDTALALINNSYNYKNHQFVEKVLKNEDDYWLVSPDAGAYKKIFGVARYVGYKKDIVISNKFRDVTNGVIRSIDVSHQDLEGKPCYIVDDICDGGGTFVLLAEELKKRNAGKINLIVSHGIFSKGFDLKGIDRIFTTSSFKDIMSFNSSDNIYTKRLNQFSLGDGLLFK